MEAATPTLTEPAAGYAPPEEKRPLAGYAALAGLFQLLVAAAVFGLRRSGKSLPERLSHYDLLLTGVASYKLGRLIGKEKVTSFIRAPFTEYQGRGAPGEVEEKARGEGLRRAAGELLVCPYCLSRWAATALALGLIVAPRATRLVAFVLTTLGISDFLQIAYKAADRAARRPREPSVAGSR